MYFISSYQKIPRQQICTNLHKSICEDECGFVDTSHLKDAHFSIKRCALLSLELTTPHQPPCATTHPFVAQRSIVCCAREHLLLRNKIGTPPKLRTSKSPSYESISRLSDYALSSARTTHKTIIPTNHTTHSRHDCGPSHEPSGPDGILKPLSNSSLNFSHIVIITFYHKI